MDTDKEQLYRAAARVSAAAAFTVSPTVAREALPGLHAAVLMVSGMCLAALADEEPNEVEQDAYLRIRIGLEELLAHHKQIAGETDRPMIHWDRAKLKRFRTAYRKAEMARDSEFMFDGHLFDVRYAGYLIQFLESKLPR